MDIGSVEQTKQLAKALEDAKKLIQLEEERLAKIVEKEAELSTKRVSYLKDCNDEYTTLLNNVSTQCMRLNHDIAGLANRLTEAQKELRTLQAQQKKSNAASNVDNEHPNKDTDVQASTKPNAAIENLSVAIQELRNEIATRGHRPSASTVNSKDLPPSKTVQFLREQNGNAEEIVSTIRAAFYGDTAIGSETAATAETTSTPAPSKPSTFSTEEQINELNKITRQDIEDIVALTGKDTKQAERAKAQEDAALEGLKKSAENLANLKLDLDTPITAEKAKNRQLEIAITEDTRSVEELAKKRANYIASEELRLRLKNNGKVTEDEIKKIHKVAEKRFSLDKKNLDKITEERIKQEKRDKKEARKKDGKQNHTLIASAVTRSLTKDDNLIDRFKELNKATDSKVIDKGVPVANAIAKGIAAIDTAMIALSAFASKLNKTVDEIGLYKGDIDTRLQGSNNTQYMGSYWDQITKDIMKVGVMTPYFKQADFSKNVKTLVDRGISFDLEQRAFLMTIQEKIATTFEVADGTLLRLIRLQQEDSTAGRLGMESSLNAFLNEMYENTEYLKDVAANVRGSLQEMEALMSGAAAATEVEYQVQKWMGSLYSVGMSQEAVQGIASALGQIAAGQIEGLTGGNGAGNLLVMAANSVGKSISDILATGLNADETNSLLQATVNYLAEIAESSKGNNVVQQQVASVFGVKASDLKAATNLAVAKSDGKYSIGDIYNSSLTYDNMLDRLNAMAGTMYKRTSMGEMLNNIWENLQYSLAGGIASSPVTYAIYKVAGLLDDTVGGIPVPDITTPLGGVALNTTVADVMRVAAMSEGFLRSIGDIASALTSSFDGQAMLSAMGIESGTGLAITPRGGGGLGALDTNEGGGTKMTSGSGYVGNTSGSDIKNSTLQEVEDTKKQQMIEALEETPADRVDMINTTVLKIYELLDNVTKGNQTLRVRVDNYGLTGSSSAGGAQGGVSGLLNNSTSNSNLSTSGTVGSSNNKNSNDNGFSSSVGAVDLGGWTMT